MKTRLLTICIILIAFANYSISQISLTTQYAFGGNQQDIPGQIISLNDGSYIVSLITDSIASGTKSETGYGERDVYLVKYSSTFYPTAQKSIGGSEEEGNVRMIKTSDGNILVATTSKSDISGSRTVTRNSTEQDILVIKMDYDFNEIWQKTISPPISAGLRDMKELSNGDIVFTIQTDNGIGLDKSESGIGLGDYWCVRTDANLNILWDKTFGGTDGDFIADVLELPNSNLLFFGTSGSNISGQKTEASYGSYDLWLVKTDANGTFIEDKTLGSNSDDVSTKSILYNNEIYLLSHTNSDSNAIKSENKLSTHILNKDIWALKLDTDLNVIWENTIGGTSREFAYDLMFENGNALVISHTYSNASDDISEDRLGMADIWIFNLDINNGNITTDKKFGGSELEVAYNITKNQNDEYIILAYSESNNSFDHTFNNYGMGDLWILKVDATLGIESFEEISEFGIDIFPNPAEDHFNLRSKEEIQSIQITAVNGTIIKNEKLLSGTYSYQVKTNNLDAGIYLVNVKSNAGQISRKIVVR